MAFLGTLTRRGLQPRGYILGRLVTTIVQSVSGDARDVPLTTEFSRWSYGLGARERQSCPFVGNDARFTGLARAARRSI